MPRVYDNWERLLRAVLRRNQLRLIAERTPSALSLASSSSSNFTVSSRRLSSFELPSFLDGRAIDYDEILRASNYFSNSTLIRAGHSGDLFYGVLDSEIPVVVKKIDLSSAQKELSCLAELEVFGKVSHHRLVPLIGYCLDSWNDMFLVYKYMSNRDLASSLFRELDPDEYSLGSLDWITRLKIAIGAAEALSYLHHECFPPLVHRDVQASSILLDDKYEVRLGSLSDVCAQKEEKQKENNQNRFTRFLRLPRPSVKGTSGTPNATCAYDVYCFGKVLLELVTGRLGISASGDAAMKQDWLEQTLPYISIYDKELVVKIVDPFLIVDEDLLDEVWAIAIVARSCLNPQSSRRPIMRYVLKALENPLRVGREENNRSAMPGEISTISSKWRYRSSDVAATFIGGTDIAEGASSFKE